MWDDLLTANDMKDQGHRIFNLDETGINTAIDSGLVYTKKGVRDCYQKAPDCGKTMYTVLFCGSASGVYTPPFVVYKSKHLYREWIIGGPAGCGYSCNESGYMMDFNFENWFIEVFCKFVESYDKPVIVVFDGHGSHLTYTTIKYAMDQEIIIVCLPPNTSHALQPLDVAVFKGFKDFWISILKKYYSDTKNRKNCAKEVFPKLLAKLCQHQSPDNLIAGFRGSGLFPVDKHKIDSRILEDTIENIEDKEDLPTPHKAMRQAVITILTPPEPATKRGPRKRVQAVMGEIMTEEKVAERLRVEEEERKRKRAEKAEKLAGKGKGRGRGKGASKTTVPKRLGKNKSGAAPKATAAPEGGSVTAAFNKRKPNWSKNLFKKFDLGEDSSDEEEEDVIVSEHPELRKKHMSGLWSDDSDSEFGENPQSLREDLGIEDMFGDSDASDDNVPIVKSTGTKSRPLPASSSEPVAGTSGVRKRHSKEAWTTHQTDSSSSEENLHTIASQVDSDDMFGNSDEDLVANDEDVVDNSGDGAIRENVTYVIVDYEGSKFPGIVTKIVGKHYEVSCMKKSGIKQWQFDTDSPDLCLYERSDIVEIIKAPTIINSRNAMRCEEADKYWGGI